MDIDISVIVPVYNCEKEIGKGIKSLIRQTKKEIEIIIVNDGSTDNSLDVCNILENKDDRITVVTQKNKGVSSARNKGIEVAQGSAIMFMDADDYVDRTICQSLWDLYRKGNSYCICGYAHEFCNRKNRVIRGSNVLPKRKEYGDLKVFFEDIVEMYKNYLIFIPVAKLYDANIIRKNNIRFNENISVGEDLLFNIAFLEQCDHIGSINKALYYYRHKEKRSSLTTTFNPRRIEWAEEIYDRTSQFAKKYNQNDMMASLILDKYYRYSICTVEVLYSKKCTIDKTKKREYLSQIINNASGKCTSNLKLGLETSVYAALFKSRQGWLLKIAAILRQRVKRFFR